MYFSARRPKIFTTSFGSTSDGGGGRGEGEEMVAVADPAAEDDVSSSDVVDDDKTTTESSSWRLFEVPWHDGLDVNIGGAKLAACPARIMHSRK